MVSSLEQPPVPTSRQPPMAVVNCDRLLWSQRQVKLVGAHPALLAALWKHVNAHFGSWETRVGRSVDVVFVWAAAKAAKSESATTWNCIVVVVGGW